MILMDAILVLKKSGANWVLVAPKGHIVHELHIRTTTREAAYDEARAWASSWGGVTIRFEDEQDKKTD